MLFRSRFSNRNIFQLEGLTFYHFLGWSLFKRITFGGDKAEKVAEDGVERCDRCAILMARERNEAQLAGRRWLESRRSMHSSLLFMKPRERQPRKPESGKFEGVSFVFHVCKGEARTR